MTVKSAQAADLFGNPWEPPRDPRGRRRHRPNAQVREIVAQLKGAKATDEEIARQLGLCVKTLQKYYFRELTHGLALARNEVIQALYKKAKDGNVSAMREYLRQTKEGAALEAAYRPAPAPAARPARLGKKEERQAAAEQVSGFLAPGAPPAKLTSH